MIVYAQTKMKEPVLGADRWKVIHTIELPRDEFFHFKNHLLNDHPFIAEHAEELYVDRTRTARGLLVLCEGSEDGILVNSEGSSYARYSTYLTGARSLVMLDRYPALKKFFEEMSDLTEKYTQKILDSQVNGAAELSVDYDDTPDGFSLPLFLEMLAERPEIEAAEDTLSEIRVTVAGPYIQSSGPVQTM